MEHVFTLSLLFITWLQLCRAELSGTWYSANIINDREFSPKPISDLFTTDTPFSSTHPIVVLQPSMPSSKSPSLSTSYSTTDQYSEFVSTTPSPPTQSTFESSSSTYGSTASSFQSPNYQDSQPILDFKQSLFPFPAPQDTQQPNGPNYFLIYQQAPQSLQNAPTPASQQTFSTFQPPSTFQSSSTFQPSSTFEPSSTFQPELSTPQSTLSTIQPEISTFSTTFSTFRPEISTPQTTLGTFQPSPGSTVSSISPSSFPPNSTPFPQTLSTSSLFPCNTSQSTPSPLSKFPSLRIRMVVPSGSITNINVNPVVSTSTRRTTTRRTTTRRPTTTRTRRTKKNRNTYDSCMNSCEGRRPICGTPLAVSPIDPDRLKGFPSICHMACHNSFRKEQYEMLVEGRCGRLRTRIQTVDSNKLKRIELNKAQYTIVGQDPQTVVEFSALPR